MALNLRNDNGSFFKQATVSVSTIKLPICIDNEFNYETCVFAGGENDVVERYASISEAVEGHWKHCNNYIRK